MEVNVTLCTLKAWAPKQILVDCAIYKKVKPKQVTIFPDLQNRNRCPVRLIYRYHSLLPMNRTYEALYLRPRINYSPRLWFQDMPISINKLWGFVKEITTKAGLDGYFMNHSLRSTTATHLYQGGVEEQVITEITGHRSLVVRGYKRTHEDQRYRASQILMDNPVKKSCLELWPDWHKRHEHACLFHSEWVICSPWCT